MKAENYKDSNDRIVEVENNNEKATFRKEGAWVC